MIKNYMNFLYKKAQKYARMYDKYDKWAQNPFLELNNKYNHNKGMYEQTFVWVIEPNNYND